MSILNKNIASAKAFISDGIFQHVVGYCKLIPTDNWRTWHDHDGNKISIMENKTVKVFNKKALNFTHDIFKKSKPAIIVENSCWLCSLYNKNHKYDYLTGNDNIIRCCYYLKNEWVCNQSPIENGYQEIHDVIKRYMYNIEFDSRYKILVKEL
jgi:hypothetical protein